MCGIFGYKGPQNDAATIVIEGLKKLEYRGYDSWGIAYKTKEEIKVHKQVGKISEFDPRKANLEDSKEAIGETEEQSNHKIAIAHTRWATHGGVTQRNSHPHSSTSGDITVVHNGIFENFLELKEELVKKDISFKSDTDTEVLPHLIEEYIKNGMNFEEAVKVAVSKLEGRYAILAISHSEDKLIAARRGSPLIVGINEKDKEFFVASDIPAFSKYTNKVMYLDDNQMVIIDTEAKFYDMQSDKEIKKRIIEIDWNEDDASKGDYPHFMIKEICEQKDTLTRAINQDEEKIMQVADAIEKAFGTFLVGCGTAGKVCMAAEYMFAKIAKKHVNVTFGSEFHYFKDFLREGSLLICVSQSGETADTIEAIEVAKEKGAKIISIVNVESSTMARISDIVIPIKAGPEKAVASTKATTSQLAILNLIAHACADKLAEGKQLLINAASQINDMLNPRYEDHIHTLAENIKDEENLYIIGKGKNYPIALEAAIKIQEVSYIHAEGFAGGELKHGPIALISKGTPCIAIVANDEAKKDIISNTMEIKARGGYIIGVSPENHEIFDYWLKVPDIGSASPIVNIIPIQILAYQLAVLREHNPDMPRNLAKSVTVK